MKEAWAIKRLAVCAWVIVMILAVTAPFKAEAASKKAVYVISSIKTKGQGRLGVEENYTKKIKYNSKGLITNISQPDSEDISYSFKYDNKGRVKRFTEKIGKGSHKATSIYTYHYKAGRLQKRILSSTNGDANTNTFTYNNKGRITAAKVESTWKEETGEIGSETHILQFKYQKGHVVKQTGLFGMTMTRTLDKHANISSYVMTMPDGSVMNESYLQAHFTYNKSKRIKTRKFRYRNPMMDHEENLTQTVKYKKIKVNKKYVDLIKAQQWQLMNADGAPNGASDEAAAW